MVRAMEPGDLPLIMNSWMMSYEVSKVAKRVGKQTYFKEYRPVVESLVQHGSTAVACNANDRDQIFGWLCAEPGVLHYIFVKKPFRGLGIARQLLGSAGIESDHPVKMSHLTSYVKYLNRYNAGYYPMAAFVHVGGIENGH